MQFQISSIIGKENPESSGLEFSGKFMVKNFALPDRYDKTSGPLYRGLLAVQNTISCLKKSHKSCFWKMIDSFGLKQV